MTYAEPRRPTVPPRVFLLALATSALAVAGAVQGSAGGALAPLASESTHADPAGDAIGDAPDMTAVTIRADDADVVRIRISFANRPVPDDDDLVLLLLDTDRTTSTGSAGFEYLIGIEGETSGADLQRWNGSAWVAQTPEPSESWTGGVLTVTFPDDLIGAPAGFGLQIASTKTSTSGLDAAPDDGTWVHELFAPGSGGPPPPSAPPPAPVEPPTPPCDPVDVTCEPAADGTAPVLGLARRRLRVDPRGGITLRLTCPAPEVRCRGHLALRTVRAFAPAATRTPGRDPAGRRARVFLGERGFALRGGAARALRVQLTREARMLIRRAGPVRVELTIIVQDAELNLGISRHALTLAPTPRRPRAPATSARPLAQG